MLQVDFWLSVGGTPTFAVGNEIFWGDDRREDAIAGAKGAGART